MESYILSFELTDGRTAAVVEIRSGNIAYDLYQGGTRLNPNATQSLTHDLEGYPTEAQVKTLIEADCVPAVETDGVGDE